MIETIRLGRVFVSTRAKALLSIDEISAILRRHATGEQRISESKREVFSVFTEHGSHQYGLELWVVTEPNPCRTTVMLPCETPYRKSDIEFSRTEGVTAEEVSALRDGGIGNLPSRPVVIANGRQPSPTPQRRIETVAPPSPRSTRTPRRRPNVPTRAGDVNTLQRPPSRVRDAYRDETAALSRVPSQPRSRATDSCYCLGCYAQPVVGRIHRIFGRVDCCRAHDPARTAQHVPFGTH